MSHDLVIRNGSVVDGSGLPSRRADVGISEGRIVSIGRIPERGVQDIDAEGCAVTPGFIDGHTHMDAQIMWDTLGSCSCWHGVTTAVMGNCGFTLAPVRSDRHDLVVRNLERAEDISATAMAQGINWSWETFPEYLDALDRLDKGINYAGYIGHSALRTWAMGERAFEETATEQDLARMGQQLRESLYAGAMGFTTSRSINHETSDGRPVASRLASWEEVRHLVGILGELKTGIFEIAQEAAIRSGDPAERAEVFDRVRSLAVDTGVPCTFGVSPTRADGADWRSQLELIDSSVAAGGRMFGQTHSRGISLVLSFRTHLPFDVLTEWKKVRSLPIEEQQRMLRDPVVRENLINAAYHGDYGRTIGAESRSADFSAVKVLNEAVPPIVR